MGITSNAGLVSGWFDNFDLFLSTPNGRRETHAMATEFQSHPVMITENNSHPGISAIKIPRLALNKGKSIRSLNTIPFLHYSGPKKVLPPLIQPRHIGVSYSEVCAQHARLEAAQVKDVKWLNNLSKEDDAMEWNGFNKNLSKSVDNIKPATVYMIGPLIDAPSSHPDTILTTITYMQESLLDMGMKKVHLSIDMQLYAVTKQVCWYHFAKFHNAIAHPGGMHM